MNTVRVIFFLFIAICTCNSLPLPESSLEVDDEDYPEYRLGVRYDEYPMIVPKKRTALLVNRLMVALKDAIEESEKQQHLKSNFNKIPSRTNDDFSSENVRQMDLERRGRGNMAQQKGRSYWRCYFNAVTCF